MEEDVCPRIEKIKHTPICPYCKGKGYTEEFEEIPFPEKVKTYLWSKQRQFDIRIPIPVPMQSINMDDDCSLDHEPKNMILVYRCTEVYDELHHTFEYKFTHVAGE